MKNVVIIGGGYSGVLTAVNVGRLAAGPMHISIIDNGPMPCRGVAYATRNGSHLLNVVARNMSALADQPNHFVEWLATRADYLDLEPAALREKFLPRRVYGEYVHGLFQSYAGILAEEKGMKFDLVRDAASDVEIAGPAARVVLESGRIIPADRVVLALGNQPPAPFRLKGLDSGSAKYIGNPWLGWETALPPADRDLLIIGTGLTMVDAFLSLKDLGWKGKIFAVSRNGWLPRSHFKGFEYPDYLHELPEGSPLRALFALFKKHWREVEGRGLNPAILVDKLRPHTQRLWRSLSLVEKRRFNRHLRTRWNVVRHRIAPEIHRQLEAGLTSGRLEVIKGRLRGCEESKEAMKMTVDCGGKTRILEVGAVINCTGPKENYLPSESALLNNLQKRGLIQADEMNMGIKVMPDFAVVGRDGEPSRLLYATGSIMKGTLWETLAVPELRSQAFRLAETIAGKLGAARGKTNAVSETIQDMIEYSI